MEIVICPNENIVGQVAAGVVAQVARRVGPSIVLGVAAGSSPLVLYRELARLVTAGEIDLSEASAFALDEYVGLPPGHPESYADVVRRTVTEPLGLDPARVHTPDRRPLSTRRATWASPVSGNSAPEPGRTRWSSARTGRSNR